MNVLHALRSLKGIPAHGPLHLPRPHHWELSRSVGRLDPCKGNCLTRSTRLRDGTEIGCLMNCVSYQKQAQLGFFSLYLVICK